MTETHSHTDESLKHEKGKKPVRKEYMRDESSDRRLKTGKTSLWS